MHSIEITDAFNVILYFNTNARKYSIHFKLENKISSNNRGISSWILPDSKINVSEICVKVLQLTTSSRNSSFLRLLHSPSLVAIGLSVGYETWPPIDQSHRYGRPQAACREPAGSYDKTTRTAICFKLKNATSFNPCSIYPHCGILAHQ